MKKKRKKERTNDNRNYTYSPIRNRSGVIYGGQKIIEKRQSFWKEKQYQTVERGKGWEIQRPVEIKPLEDLLDDFFRKKKKWE